MAILGEDRSDANTLKTIIRRLLNNDRATIKSKGFSGCGELCRKAASVIRLFARQGASRFVICHDADGPDPQPVREKVHRKIVAPSGIKESCCILVPVQELEAWIIADVAAIQTVIPKFQLKEIRHPENIKNPKEWLVQQSRRNKSRPLYSTTTYNESVAHYLDLDKVAQKCPSFKPLIEFVRGCDQNREETR